LDRPQNSGWVTWSKDILNPDARTVCQNALQTAHGDAVQQRRLLLEFGRSFETDGSFDDAIKAWNQAGALGSGQAYTALAEHYRQQKNMTDAWSNYMKAVALHNPAALNAVAISLLFPDYTGILQKGNSKSGAAYLEQALSAHYYRAYYIAGLAHWKGVGYPADRDVAYQYFLKAWCDKNDQDAYDFYAKNSNPHAVLTCQ
jgi:hypothetical protein